MILTDEFEVATFYLLALYTVSRRVLTGKALIDLGVTESISALKSSELRLSI